MSLVINSVGPPNPSRNFYTYFETTLNWLRIKIILINTVIFNRISVQFSYTYNLSSGRGYRQTEDWLFSRVVNFYKWMNFYKFYFFTRCFTLLGKCRCDAESEDLFVYNSTRLAWSKEKLAAARWPLISRVKHVLSFPDTC